MLFKGADLYSIETIKTKRISAHFLTNQNKTNTIIRVFNEILIVKNQISKRFNNNRNYQDKLFKGQNLKDISKNFKYPNLLAWETQKFINDNLILNSEERIERQIKSFKPKLFELVNISKNPKKVKLKKLFKKTNLSQLLELLIMFEYYKFRLPKSHKILIDSKSKILNLISLINTKSRFNKLKRVIKLKNLVINKIKYFQNPINYKTGSIIKINQKELGITPRLIKDTTNSKFQYFYSFDFRDSEDSFKTKTIKIPLAYKEKYHQNMKLYSSSLGKNKFKKKPKNLKKSNKFFITKKNSKIEIENLLDVEHIISLSAKTNRLTIGLTHNSNYKFKESKLSKTIGIDIGGGLHNTIATSNNELIGFKFLENIVEKLNNIETKDLTKDFTAVDKATKLKKVYRENVSNIKFEIKTFLDECLKKKIYDIVMEDLNVFSSLGFAKNKEMNEKQNRIFRLLRMSGMVELFRDIARNRGIRVHTIPSYYTSKWCRKCTNIHNNNRNGKVFKCTECGFNDDADINASKNIKIIFGKFPDKFCEKNSFGEYSAKKYLKKEFVKQNLLEFNSNIPNLA